MALVHVLTGDGDRCTCTVHKAMPTGNNSKSVSWSDCFVGAGLNTSVMTVGTGSGQITQAELDDIEAGTTFEVVCKINVGKCADDTALGDLATQEFDKQVARLKEQYKYFGHSCG